MATRRVTLADLSPGRSDISALILRRGQTQAEAEMRSGEIWGNALQNVGQTLAGGLQQYGQQHEDSQVSEAVNGALRDPGSFDLNSVPTHLRGTVLENIQKAAPGVKAMRDAQDTQTLDKAVEGAGGGLDANAIEASLPGHMRAAFRKSWADANESAIKMKGAQADYFARLGVGIKPFLGGEDRGLGAAKIALDHAKEAGVSGTDQLWEQIQQDPSRIPQIVDSIIAQSPTVSKEHREATKPTEISPGASLMGPDGKLIATAPERPASLQHVETDKGIQTFDPRTGQLGAVIGKGKPQAMGGMNGLYGGIDPKAIADSIERGEQPPAITDLGRPVGAAVSSELAKRGFNLAQAATDWKATQRHISSMNGPQQLRLNQSINALPDLLDTVDGLAEQWKGGKFPILNKANLAIAKAGAYGKDAAVIANKLDAQIADVVADLGNVYMGGNSPTDHAFSLAGKSLSGDWDEKVLREMVKMAKVNVTIRRNSIQNTGVSGASAGNPYDGGQGAPAPPPQSGGQHQVGERKVFPNGKVGVWDGHGYVAQ